MAINGPIIAANMLPRANARITAIPIVRAIPPASIYELQEDVAGTQLLGTVATNMDYNRSGGSYTSNTIANPVNASVDGDTWTGASSVWFGLPFITYSPGYYTYSLYARGISPTPSSTLTFYVEETAWFAGSTGLLETTTVTVPNGIWTRFSLTVYVANPNIQHRIVLSIGAGQSLYLACFQWEPGLLATTWRNGFGATTTTDIYTEIKQTPLRQGQIVGYVSEDLPGVLSVNFYVVVNINGTLTWKPVVGISETIDSRTGKPFDPLLDFYSGLA